MSTDPSGAPRYRQIADELKSGIDSGRYAPGDRLPGENALMETYGVARMTARQALATLQTEGLAVARKGAGVFVREFRPVVREGIARLSRQTWGQGVSIWDADAADRTVTVDAVTITEEDAPAHVAHLLGREVPVRVCVRDRRYLLDGRPVMTARSSLPADLVGCSPVTQEDTGPGGTYARLAEMGHAPAHFREDIRSRMPGEHERRILDLDAGTPVLEVVRLAVTEEGRVVEVTEMLMDAGAYVLRYDFDA